jgi:hypothetical protein
MADLGNPAAENNQGSDDDRPVDDTRDYDISGNIDPTKASRVLVNIGSVYPMTACVGGSGPRLKKVPKRQVILTTSAIRLIATILLFISVQLVYGSYTKF